MGFSLCVFVSVRFEGFYSARNGIILNYYAQQSIDLMAAEVLFFFFFITTCEQFHFIMDFVHIIMTRPPYSNAIKCFIS